MHVPTVDTQREREREREREKMLCLQDLTISGNAGGPVHGEDGPSMVGLNLSESALFDLLLSLLAALLGYNDLGYIRLQPQTMVFDH
jgi:hypothetical protein